MKNTQINWREVGLFNTFAILIPADPELAQELIDQYLDGGINLDETVWLGIYPGKTSYCALIDIENDGGDSADHIIESLSPALPEKKIYLLFFNEVHNDPVIVFVDGQQVETSSLDPFAVGEQILGIPLPDAPEPIEMINTSVCVVLGSDEEKVRKIIETELGGYPPFDLYNDGNRIIIHNQSIDTSDLMIDISDALENVPVYALSFQKSGNRFIYSSMKGLVSLGIYQYPKNFQEDEDPEDEFYRPVLNDVLGETEPIKIAQKLGVPLHLLGLEQ